jgi:hypothetical protein
MWVFVLVAFMMTLAQQDEITVTLRADTTTPRVGEPVTFTLRVMYPDFIEIIHWPELPDQWGAFEIIERDDITTEQNDDQIIQSQIFTAVLWQVGDFVTPETTLDYRRQGLDETLTTVIPDLFFSVPSIIPTDEIPRLQPDRDPVGFSVIPPWLVLIGTIIASGGTYVIGRTWWENHRTNSRSTAEAPSIDRVQQVNVAIETVLSQQEAIDIDDVRQVFEAIWFYLGARFRFNASESSFNETLHQLQSRLPRETFKAFEQIVRQYEQLRFSPTSDDRQALYRLVTWVAHWFQQVEADQR